LPAAGAPQQTNAHQPQPPLSLSLPLPLFKHIPLPPLLPLWVSLPRSFAARLLKTKNGVE